MTLAPCPQCGTNTTPGLPCTSCGTPTPAPIAAPSGDPYIRQWEAILEKLQRVTEPKYVVKGILGYGGMAGVYLADEPRLGRKVAIKVMAPGLMVDPKLVERFGQEARTIAQLSHPHIVTIYEVDEREGLHWFAMTYVAGRTLGQVLGEAVEQLPVQVVRAWLYQIGDALAFAHNYGIVHRDIKPGNVLIDTRGNALVTDFGIAKVADTDSGLTRTGMLVGTPAYMSPEQCSSGAIGGASDQYSLGTVAYQMLTGQPPFAGVTLSVLQAHLSVEPTPIRELRPDCPEELATAIERMLQKRPEDRWESMSASVAGMGAAPPGLEGPLRDQLKLLAAPTVALKVPVFPEAVQEGSRERLHVQLHDSSGRQLAPRRIEWTSSDPSIACVVGDHTLLALSPGVAYVGGYSGAASLSLRVNVVADEVRAVTIPAQASIASGESRALEAEVLDIDESPLPGRAVLWTSSDPKIATVSVDGALKGIAAGTVVLTARTGGKTADMPIVVTPAKRADRTHASSPGLAHASAVRATKAKSLPGTIVTPVPKPRDKRLVMGIAGAALIVVAAVAYYVRPVGPKPPPPDSEAYVTLNAPAGVPEGAKLTITDKAGESQTLGSGRMTVKPDHYLLSFSAPGYVTDTLAIDVKAGETRSWTPVLTPDLPPPVIKAYITLNAQGLPNDANLTFAGNAGPPRTLVPGRTTVEPGHYVLRFSAPGYVTETRSIDVREGETAPWTPKLEKSATPAYVTLNATERLPEGVRLTITDNAGRSQPIVPGRTTVEPGLYVLRFSAPGYVTETQTIDVKAGETHPWTPAINPEPKPATPPTPTPVKTYVVLTVPEGVPEGFKVTITPNGGEPRTIPPGRTAVEPGHHVLTFTAPGYVTDTQAIDVRAGETQPWTPNIAKAGRVEDEAEIQTLFNKFFVAFSNRDPSVLGPLGPIPRQDEFLVTLMTKRGVSKFKVTMGNPGTPSFSGSGAVLQFTLNVNYYADNRDNPLSVPMVARFEKSSKWELVSVRYSR